MHSCSRAVFALSDITARETFRMRTKHLKEGWCRKTYAFSRELFFTQWHNKNRSNENAHRVAQVPLKNKIQNIWATACATSDATHGRGQSILKESRNPIGACVSLDSFKSRLRASKSQRRMCDSERFPVTINEESSLSPNFSFRFPSTSVSGSSYRSSTRYSVQQARKGFIR